jgi:hypothetical protein
LFGQSLADRSINQSIVTAAREENVPNSNLLKKPSIRKCSMFFYRYLLVK